MKKPHDKTVETEVVRADEGGFYCSVCWSVSTIESIPIKHKPGCEYEPLAVAAEKARKAAEDGR